MVSEGMPRKPELEGMDDTAEVEAYARADFADVNAAFVGRLLEIAGARERALALDLGTGPGDIPRRIAHARPNWRLVALDSSLSMLNVARRAIGEAGLAGSIDLVIADAKDTGLKSKGFDVILSNSILHHVTGAALFWGEVKRVGKRGTAVLVRDLARPATPEDARAIVSRYAGRESDLLKEEYYRSLLSAYRPEEVREQLARSGLTSLQVAMVSDRHLDVFGYLP